MLIVILSVSELAPTHRVTNKESQQHNMPRSCHRIRSLYEKRSHVYLDLDMLGVCTLSPPYIASLGTANNWRFIEIGDTSR